MRLRATLGDPQPKYLVKQLQPANSPSLLRVDFVELAVLFPGHAQRLSDLAVRLQAHGLQLLRAFGDQLQRQLPRSYTLLLGRIFEGPFDLLGLLMRIQLADFFEQLRVGVGEALQRHGLTGFFCNHGVFPLPTAGPVLQPAEIYQLLLGRHQRITRGIRWIAKHFSAAHKKSRKQRLFSTSHHARVV